MEAGVQDQIDEAEDDGVPDGTPLCLNCLEEVDPYLHVCPHCGAAIGQFTPYLPFEKIRWEAQIWGAMWRQIGARRATMIGSLVRLFMIIFFVPVVLLALIPMGWNRLRRKEA